MVYYRKYRNQTIDELDNASIRERLSAILAHPGSIPHAFIFTGPKGLGKTSSARIVAKVVNCQAEEGDTKPCNKCEQCLLTTSGNNLDVIEIDAASNRGIDEIRDLKDKIKLPPLQAKKKIYIIDEVHMLTSEAFNALLKTLEEPPSHAMFILCTTEIHKVPQTIFSRCFHLSFTKASPEELVRSFRRIVTGEKLKAQDEALFAIANLSEGGFRDGAKILEEVAALAKGEEITLKLLEQKYHTQNLSSLVEGMGEALKERKLEAGLKLVGEIEQNGIEFKYFLQKLIETLHIEMLDKVQKNRTQAEEILKIISLLSTAYEEQKAAVIPQLPLEIALITRCNNYTEDEEGKNSKTGEVIKESEHTKKSESGVNINSLRQEVGNLAKKRALYGEEKTVKMEKQTMSTTDLKLEHLGEKGEITTEWLETFWKCLISETKKHNHTLAGVLRGCRLKSFNASEVNIEAPYAFHKEKLEAGKHPQILSEICDSLLGRKVTIKLSLKGK